MKPGRERMQTAHDIPVGRAYSFSHTSKKASSPLGPENYCPSGLCVCVCRREVWKAVLLESLSVIFLVTFFFVSFFPPFKEIIPLFEMRFVAEI